MPTITFVPPANRQEWERACDVFCVPGHPYYTPNTLNLEYALPCDLTLDPTKPETWARAVYEAGRRSCDEQTLPGHFCSYCSQIRPATQQPSTPKPERTRCQYCDQWDDKSKMDVIHRDGWMVFYAHKECDKPQQPAKVPVCKLCERYLWDGPKSQVNGWSFCGHGCADTYYQTLHPKWKPPEKIDLNGVEYRPVTAPQSDPRSGACS